jgi:predicted nucleic acid-binding protein
VPGRGLQVATGYPTLCEAHTLVLRRLGIDYARQWLTEMLEGAVLLNPEVTDYTMAAAQLDRFPDQTITLVDAVAAVMASRLGMSVWSFDRHFATMRVKLWR